MRFKSFIMRAIIPQSHLYVSSIISFCKITLKLRDKKTKITNTACQSGLSKTQFNDRMGFFVKSDPGSEATLS